MAGTYANFRDFYAFYLAEHTNRKCRRLHVVGTTLVIITLLAAVFTQHWMWLWLMPLIGYGFAWVGHFFFEKNRPATFTYPLYSFIGDWVMWWQVVSGRLKF